MQSSSTTTFPKAILFEKWADIGFAWQGQLALTSLERVYDLLNPHKQQDNPTLKVHFRLDKQDGVVWLDFTVQGILWLTCHRCLEPISEPVDSHYRLAVITEDSQLTLIDGADYLVYQELEGGRLLPVADILEDELLLALPLSLTHEDCQAPVQFDDTPSTQDNPFALLASLKSTLP